MSIHPRPLSSPNGFAVKVLTSGLMLAFGITACGGSTYRNAGSSVRRSRAYSGSEQARLEVGSIATSDSSAGSYESYDLELAASSAESQGFAGVSTPAPPPQLASISPVSPVQSETATDAVDLSQDLLVYVASVVMAVYEVRETQARLIASAREVGGFVAQQSDAELRLRIPAARFHPFMATLGEEGRILDRSVVAEDVGEEFRDLAIRIRNLDITRARIEALLAQAANVQEALAVQRELERVTSELEGLRGRQRYLADRLAFSTITIRFQALAHERVNEDEVFRLPFRWLQTLGLGNLLEMQ